MERLVHGDRQALDPLVERYHVRVYRIALSYLRDADDALDATQEVFVKVAENAAAWRPTATVAPWLTRLAVNHAIDRYRRRRRRTRLFEPLDGSAADPVAAARDANPERLAAGREIGRRIAVALQALSDRQRAVVVLRHQEEMSLAEIAETLGVALGTVKSTLHRALDRLRDELREDAP